ncbi:MAG: tetratricopeptide repeat protein [Myxococcales bacterium]|nr:tetratricopeptide repeat protein [Myxococcales bacterium]
MAYFRYSDPRTLTALVPLLILAFVLFTRHPATNYIFDEQEALLANPYVNGLSGLRYWDVIHRDFWGLPPEASIGSYRPLPNLLWRAVWSLHHFLPEKAAHLPKHPFFHHLFNIVLHALNGALLGSFAFAVSKRRALGWLTALAFVASALLTEAVCGIVGLADVLGGLGAILALHALRLPALAMPFAVFAAVLFGMFAKESALVCVPLVPLAALVCAPLLKPERPARVVRMLLAFAGAALAFFLYVKLRKYWFPSPLPALLEAPLAPDASRAEQLYRALLVWFHQAPLPRDAINNPLISADFPHRVAGAMRVYWRGLTQLVLPIRLSGDYSFPQEPVPATLTAWETIAGATMTAAPLLGSLALWISAVRSERRERRRLLEEQSTPAEPRRVFRPQGVWPWRFAATTLCALGFAWVVVSYFPHSNIPVLLPTVRAERLWYFPAIGSALILGVALAAFLERGPKRVVASIAIRSWLVIAFFALQCVQAYRHSMDYRDDLSFWHATKINAPNSAKAHLNYSIMVGARGDLPTRLAESHIARALAPKWPMAHIYTGDTLCRLRRAKEAWPHYAEGFALGPNDRALIALALQCLHDEGELLGHDQELRALAEEHPGSWIAYLAIDTLDHHAEHGGVDPKHRPRSYNEGAKKQ